MNQPKTPTLQDIADRAGVATSTVSRYLNKPAVVARETGERIQEIIDELGYIPNLLAGGLASNRSKLVAILIPQMTNSLLDTTIDAMADELNAGGYTVMLGLTGASNERLMETIRAAISRRADAIVCSAVIPLGDDLIDLVRKSGTTFIQIWELPDDPVHLAIGFSHKEAGVSVAKFVYDRGYQKPYIITADGPRALLRAQGVKDEWLRLAGNAVGESVVPIPTRYGHARRVFADVKRQKEQPDVVICGSDLLAQGMIIEIMSAGLRVPDDIAVMGFGNSAIAGEMRPTISTVDVDGARIAREVMQVIQNRSVGIIDERGRINVGFRIIARESA